MRAGADKGIRPFGLEPQRILRLQKMHILVGQDTDSESTPFGAAMPWIVKLDKERGLHRQVGARALRRGGAGDPPRRVHARQRLRADRGRGDPRRARRPRRPGDVRALLAGARPRDRNGLGPEPARSRRFADHDLRRGPTLRGARSRPDRSTTPMGRCSAREPRVPEPGRRRRTRRSRAARWRARPRPPARGSRSARLERRGRVSGRRTRSRETVGWTDVSHLRKLELQGDGVPGELGEAKREGDAVDMCS